MIENTVGWFGVREKYCSLTDKPWLISQIRRSEQAEKQIEAPTVRLPHVVIVAGIPHSAQGGWI